MEIGERVRIEGTGTAFDEKEGILETLDDDTCVVYVDFIPDENKKIRQNFALNNIFPITQENILGESKKPKNKGILDLKKKSNYDLSSLESLDNVLDKNTMSILTNYPYSFNVYVSDRFVNNYNDLRKGVLTNDEQVAKFFKIFDRCFSKLDDTGMFKGVSVEKVNGLPDKYSGKIRELKLGEVNNKPIRVLFFLTPDKNIVLGNIFYHKDARLNTNERMSCNDTFDKVFKN